MKKPDRQVYLTFGGVRLSLCEWAKRTGIPRVTLAYRVSNMWTATEILTTPAGQKHPARPCEREPFKGMAFVAMTKGD